MMFNTITAQPKSREMQRSGMDVSVKEDSIFRPPTYPFVGITWHFGLSGITLFDHTLDF